MISLRLYCILLFSIALVAGEIKNKVWWKNIVFYQVYPRSFMDNDGDGVGDLKGITDKLEHFIDAGIGGIWLSPIYSSPMVDFGYDISNFLTIDPTFGTMDDLDKLLQKTKRLGIKVVMDFVPNHTSDQHEWFIKSVNGEEKYKDYYVWLEGRENNTKPPNNWISLFSGPAWKYNEKRNLWYLHQFEYRQPDLNFNNPDVHKEMNDILRFWLDKGIDGFRIDAIIHVYEKDGFPDEPVVYNKLTLTTDNYLNLNHIYTKNDPRNYDLITEWRKTVDEWTDAHNEEEKVLMTEAYTNLTNLMKYYTYGADISFNFNLITEVNITSKPSEFKHVIDEWILNMPDGKVANWVMGNHDRSRIATRYPGRVDQMTILSMILPGVAVTYYGEEIAMEDNLSITWKQTKDPQACHVDPEHFKELTRDPNRTPFQWDDSIDAGFSTALETWLPIPDNYKELNLANQKGKPESHYVLYQTLTKLRSTSIALQNGTLKTTVLNNDRVLIIDRQSNNEAIVLLINFSDDVAEVVDLTDHLPGATEAIVILANIGSGITWRSMVLVSSIELPPKVSLVLFAKVDGSHSDS
ncbi:PREDICTED: maltase 1-like [Ceratosolen solmsi marchali]|uniref:alpha-glucosidase n=1 Tax=Ceratosolen solmsi marchali TaxID=326594 RepID=A0AAJ7DUM5_9HYME|nr:PREDICTED: maltase 1-like [Ceratosolen solmsi marchali]